MLLKRIFCRKAIHDLYVCILPEKNTKNMLLRWNLFCKHVKWWTCKQGGIRWVLATRCFLNSRVAVSGENIVCQGQCRSGSICLPFNTNMLSSSVKSLGESKCQHWRDICLASQLGNFEMPCRRLIYIKLVWFCKVLCLLGYLFSWDHRLYSLQTLCADSCALFQCRITRQGFLRLLVLCKALQRLTTSIL